jgi:hypothetical protein
LLQLRSLKVGLKLSAQSNNGAGKGPVVLDDADFAELLNALKRTRADDRTLHRLQARHELSLRGFLLANGPARKPGQAATEQDTAETPA